MESLKYFFLLPILILFSLILIRMDRYFFKKNGSFSIHHLYSNLPTTSTPSPPLSIHLEQPFKYLTKGHQTYVFVSADEKQILKIYKFPSHLRKLSWIKHPFAYHLNPKRKKIQNYNLQKLDKTLKSYRLAYDTLREETGLLYIHLQKTTNLNQKVTLIDRLGKTYSLPLDDVLFVVQKKGSLIFPTLEKAINSENLEEAKKLTQSLVSLVDLRCSKHISDKDPMLEKNYGFVDGKAIQLDVGSLVYDENVDLTEEKARLRNILEDWLRMRDQNSLIN